MDQLKPMVEAVLFVSDEPLSAQKIKDFIPDADVAAVKSTIDALRADYESSGRAFTIEEIAGGYRMLTRPVYADIIARLRKARAEKKLSQAAIETLAIVAYRQPIKRVDIEAIRGVQSGEILRALMERNLVRIAGRDTVPGNPVLYGTTKEFLEVFGLNSVTDLPKPEEIK
ncbi:MAG: SMC-Scp complex subunit ScpB [Planctomycetes bacterium]|nr:SMC-Scp complex subunit ScpB [Planctomycetota bacterium]